MRECWPTITFSTADIVANSRMFWNVLAMPIDVITSGRRAVISRPSKAIWPAVGLYSPVSMLKKVVLPAPFGPMIETIERRGIEKLTPSPASRPPNAFDTPCASRIGLPFPLLIRAPRRGLPRRCRRPP